MEDGQQKEKVWNGSSATCLPTASSSSDLLSFCLPPEPPRLSLPPLTTPPHPRQAIQLSLATRLPQCPSIPTPRQVKTEPSPSPQGAVLLWLFLTFSSSLSFLNVARVGEKEAGTPGGGSSCLTAGWPAGSWSQGEKGGVLCLQTGERPPSALPPPAGAIHPDWDQWPHLPPSPSPPCVSRPQRGGDTHCIQCEGWEARRAPSKRPALTPRSGT